MIVAVDRRLSPKRFSNNSNRWAATALLWALTFVLIWTGGVTTAFADSFGLGAIVISWDRDLENPGDVSTFDTDPTDLSSGGFNQLLFAGSSAYTNGATSASASLARSLSNGSGLGSAAADLAAGTLSSFATAAGSFNTSVMVGFSDTLTPLIDGTEIFVLTVTGTLTGSNSSSGAWFALDNKVIHGTGGEPDADGCFETLNGGATSCNYTFTVPVTAGVPFKFATAIASYVNSGTTLDLSHTATIRATGVPFTSGSGVFLTAVNPAPEAVPEPATLLLFGSGLVGLGSAAWRKRSRK